MYVIKDNVLKISVRNLVEFIFRSGDIDSGTGGMSDVKAMQEGARLHRKIQKSMGSIYHAEVALKYRHEVKHLSEDMCKAENEVVYESSDKLQYAIMLEGRADGIICDLDESEDGSRQPVSDVIIDEIKTIQSDVNKLEEPAYVHKAQAMTYAYIYAKQKCLEKISVQLTYCNPETENIKRFKEDYSFEEIKSWFDSLMAEFQKWTDFIFEQREKRQASIQGLEFPYEYRKGQRNLVVSVYRCIEQSKNLYIQASTGVGKTLSTVFPSVAAMGQAYADKIFYLTSKTITRKVAEDTFEILRGNGLCFRTVTITARDKACCMQERKCNPKDCERACGHFDRINAAVYDIITNNYVIDRDCIREYADKHKVCPFEMSLDISYWCDGIICDYNYVFDPDVSLKRYFGEGVKGDYIFLVDEAHNLVDRAREMYSARLVKEDFLKIKNIVKYTDKRLAAALERCNKTLLEMKRDCDDVKVLDDIGKFPMQLERAYAGMQSFLEKYKSFEDKDIMLEFYFDVRHFLNMYDCMEQDYVVYTEHTSDKNFNIRLYCVDPSANISKRLLMGRSTIFFSATLLPVNYFKEMLSGDVEDYAVYAESSFAPENRCILVGKDVSSRYTRRGEKEYTKICRYITDTVKANPGKYMVFFPSYSFMQSVLDIFVAENECDTVEMPKSNICEITEADNLLEMSECNRVCEVLKHEGIHIAVQGSYMKEADKEYFLHLFDDCECNGSLVGFCVTGGIFSEGIDLKAESLIGVIIVGTGLPMICRERDILKNYFNDNGKDGYSYAYVYPGMNKVLQAAGRVIRTNDDKGVIELLDDRFLTNEYRMLYPREWNNVIPVTLDSVATNVGGFWQKINNNLTKM